MMSADSLKAGTYTTLAQVLVCLFLSLAITSYGLNLRCSLSLDLCLTQDCCVDCGMSALPADRVDQTAPKFEPLIALGSGNTTLMNDVVSAYCEYSFSPAEAPAQPPRLREPSRGPPSPLA